MSLRLLRKCLEFNLRSQTSWIHRLFETIEIDRFLMCLLWTCSTKRMQMRFKIKATSIDHRWTRLSLKLIEWLICDYVNTIHQNVNLRFQFAKQMFSCNMPTIILHDIIASGFELPVSFRVESHIFLEMSCFEKLNLSSILNALELHTGHNAPHQRICILVSWNLFALHLNF